MCRSNRHRFHRRRVLREARAERRGGFRFQPLLRAVQRLSPRVKRARAALSRSAAAAAASAAASCSAGALRADGPRDVPGHHAPARRRASTQARFNTFFAPSISANAAPSASRRAARHAVAAEPSSASRSLRRTSCARTHAASPPRRASGGLRSRRGFARRDLSLQKEARGRRSRRAPSEKPATSAAKPALPEASTRPTRTPRVAAGSANSAPANAHATPPTTASGALANPRAPPAPPPRRRRRRARRLRGGTAETTAGDPEHGGLERVPARMTSRRPPRAHLRRRRACARTRVHHEPPSPRSGLRPRSQAPRRGIRAPRVARACRAGSCPPKPPRPPPCATCLLPAGLSRARPEPRAPPTRAPCSPIARPEHC